MAVPQLRYEAERGRGQRRNLERPFVVRANVANQAELEAPSGDMGEMGGGQAPLGEQILGRG